MTFPDARQLNDTYLDLESRLHALAATGPYEQYNELIGQLQTMLVHPELRLEYAPRSEDAPGTSDGGRPPVARRLLKLTRYEHPQYSDGLYAAYVSSPLPEAADFTDLAECFWWAQTDKGRGMVSRYYWPRLPGRERAWQYRSGDKSVSFGRLRPLDQQLFRAPTGNPDAEAEYLSIR